LKYVVNYRGAGKRKRTFFETKEQAESFVAFKNAELKRNGLEHAEFPTALRVMAQNAVEKLKPFGRTITHAVDHYVAHLKASEKSCTAAELVKELLKAKKADGVSRRHLNDIRIRLGKFAEKFDSQPVATITRKETDDWLRSLPFSPLTRNHYRALVVLAFNFAVREGYATTNPAMGAAKAKVVCETPGILSVNETCATARSGYAGRSAIHRNRTLCRAAPRRDSPTRLEGDRFRERTDRSQSREVEDCTTPIRDDATESARMVAAIAKAQKQRHTGRNCVSTIVRSGTRRR
jgi:site-specific recombinase XerD